MDFILIVPPLCWFPRLTTPPPLRLAVLCEKRVGYAPRFYFVVCHWLRVAADARWTTGRGEKRRPAAPPPPPRRFFFIFYFTEAVRFVTGLGCQAVPPRRMCDDAQHGKMRATAAHAGGRGLR